jgi:hypothetical protein
MDLLRLASVGALGNARGSVPAVHGLSPPTR